MPNMTILILLNSLLFSWMHIVFHSPVALLYTFVGSLYFSHTYLKSGSLRLVCLEHGLYGSWLFTIGYGRDLLTDSMVQYLGI
jgi:membrane protease YdiL (CAAX protease family)